MKTRVLARRYAEAFFKAIVDKDLEGPYSDFLAFSDALHQDHQMDVVFRHPLIAAEKKIALVKQALGSQGSSIVADFMGLLLKRYRFDLLDIIADELRQLYRKHKNIVEVQVRTAVPLDEKQRAKLEAGLKTRVNGTIELIETVDPEVKGGLMVNYENRIFDATVRTRLKTLREHLSNLTAEMLSAMEGIPADHVSR